jgi:hypothetical protein
MPHPFQRVGSYIWDGDLTWEGGSAKLQPGPFFGSAFGFWLSESATLSDANVTGAQAGVRFGDALRFTGALGYFDGGGAGACDSDERVAALRRERGLLRWCAGQPRDVPCDLPPAAERLQPARGDRPARGDLRQRAVHDPRPL